MLYRRRAGESSTLRVISGDTRQVRDISLTLVPRWTQPGARALVFTYGASGLLTLAVVVPLAFARPREGAARVLLLAGGSGALWQALDASYGNLRERWLPLGWDTIDQLGYLIALVNALAVLHLFLIFPSRGSVLPTLPRLGAAGTMALVYFVPLAAALVLFELHQSAVALLWAIVGLVLLGTAGAIVHGYARPASPLARAQLRWIAAAASVIAFTLAAGPIMQVLTGGRIVLISWLVNVASFALLYLAIALAVLRYRLFDVHVVLRATLVYPLLAVLLLGGYFLLGAVVAWGAGLVLDSAEAGDRVMDNVGVRVALGLLAAACFQPLRAALLRGIDFMLYRERRALERFHEETADALARARPIEEVEALLTRRAAAQLDLNGAWLIRSPTVPTVSAGRLTRVVSASGDPDDAPSPFAAAALFVRLRTAGAPHLLSAVPLVSPPVPALLTQDPGATDLAAWYAAGARLLVPLRVQEELVGVWVLGQRRSFDLPDRADLAAIERIAAQAAILLDYARLHETHLAAQLAAQRQSLEAERVRALEQLNRSVTQERATLAALMESMRDGLIVADSGVIRYCNSRAAALLGTRAEVALGQSPEAFLGAALGSAVPAGQVSADTPTGYTAPASLPLHGAVDEVTLLGPPRRDLRLEWFPVSEGENQLGYGLLLRDVTEERALDRAKEEFTSMLSHELRSPIGVIKGFAATLLHGDDELTDSDRRESLRFVEQSSDQLLDLVNNLLDLSRISVGTFTVDPQPIRVETLIENTARQMGSARGSHRVELALAPDLPTVLADTARIEQVLRNLLDNAMKYSPAGTTIRVGATRRGGEVTVSVTDEGGGIPAEDLERLFERYQRGRDTRSVAGVGLGLAISRHLVEAHGGRIWAESPVAGRNANEPRGARLSFTLPVAPVPALTQPLIPVGISAGAANDL